MPSKVSLRSLSTTPANTETGTNTEYLENKGHYNCTCTDQWEGENCDIDVDECVVFAPCQNGGTCNNNDGGYSCACLKEWFVCSYHLPESSGYSGGGFHMLNPSHFN